MKVLVPFTFSYSYRTREHVITYSFNSSKPNLLKFAIELRIISTALKFSIYFCIVYFSLARAVGPVGFAPKLAEECCSLALGLIEKHDDPGKLARSHY